jgi:hypothetical protein
LGKRCNKPGTGYVLKFTFLSFFTPTKRIVVIAKVAGPCSFTQKITRLTRDFYGICSSVRLPAGRAQQPAGKVADDMFPGFICRKSRGDSDFETPGGIYLFSGFRLCD